MHNFSEIFSFLGRPVPTQAYPWLRPCFKQTGMEENIGYVAVLTFSGCRLLLVLFTVFTVLTVLPNNKLDNLAESNFGLLDFTSIIRYSTQQVCSCIKQQPSHCGSICSRSATLTGQAKYLWQTTAIPSLNYRIYLIKLQFVTHCLFLVRHLFEGDII